MKFNLTFALAALASTALAVTGFQGCADCAGFDHDDVFNNCQQICLTDDRVEQRVKQGCQERCHRFVLDQGCCPTSICLGKGAVRRSYPPMPEVAYNVLDELETKDVSVSLPEDAPVLDIEPGLDEHTLEKRDFGGCCASCTALAIASNRCPNSRMSIALNMAS